MEKCHNSKTRGFLQGSVKLRSFDLPDDEPSDARWCEDVSAIPLAPSILEKNGWNQARHIMDGDAEWNYYERQGCATAVHYYPKSGISSVFFCGVEIADCMFVHQLQHILWALDEDAEMKV